MAKVAVWGLKRPALYEAERTFLDPAQPEAPLTIRLRQLGGPEQLLLGERARELAEAYVTGKPAQQGENGAGAAERKPQPFSAAGIRVPMSRLLVNAAVTIEAMQVAPAEERYTFADIVGIAVMYPAAWPALLEFMAEVEGGGAARPLAGEPEPAAEPSAMGAALAPSELPPPLPSAPDNGIPLSSGTSSPLSAPSTSAAASSAEPLPGSS